MQYSLARNLLTLLPVCTVFPCFAAFECIAPSSSRPRYETAFRPQHCRELGLWETDSVGTENCNQLFIEGSTFLARVHLNFFEIIR